jgi:hypothetical protein
VDGDYLGIITTPLGVDQATVNTLLNAIKVAYNAHCGRVILPHHTVADAANTVATVDATTEATAFALANALKAAYNLHRANAAHPDADVDNDVTTAAATDLATTLPLANEIRAEYLTHIGVLGAIKTFSIKISRNATPWQGEGITMYDFPEGRCRVEASFTCLVENHHRYNKLTYGATHPVAGTEVTTATFSGNFHLKFVAQATPERSMEITIPVLRYTDPGALAPNADGGAPEATVAGVASGVDPCISVLVKNGRATAY